MNMPKMLSLINMLHSFSAEADKSTMVDDALALARRHMSIPVAAQALVYYLANEARRLGWPDTMTLDNRRICLDLAISRKRLYAVRSLLADSGLLCFANAPRRRSCSVYILLPAEALEVSPAEDEANGADTVDAAEPCDDCCAEPDGVETHTMIEESGMPEPIVADEALVDDKVCVPSLVRGRLRPFERKPRRKRGGGSVTGDMYRTHGRRVKDNKRCKYGSRRR